MKHPLLNPESTHYQMVDGVEAIERLEQMYTSEELATWAKITAMKYRLRITNKDDINKEATKINGYEAYYTDLTDEWSHDDMNDSAAHASGGMVDEDAVERTFDRAYGHVTPVEMIDEAADKLWERPVEEAMYDAKAASSKSNEETGEEATQASHGDTIGRTEERKDSELLDVVEDLQKRIGGDAKVSFVGHSEGHIVFAVEDCDPDQLPPSKELIEIVEALRPDRSRRSTPMDRGLPETFTALEGLIENIIGVRHGIFFGDINAGDVRESISNVVTEFMVAVGKIHKGD